MIAIQITNVKNCMSKLLGTDCFHDFLLEQAVIKTATTTTIEGRLNEAYFSNEEWNDPGIRSYDFQTWEDCHSLIFQLIKGKKTPVSVKITLQLKPDLMAQVIDSISQSLLSSFFLNIRFDETGMTMITGTSYTSFTMDKSGDTSWDQWVKHFLTQKEIAFEEL
ncbi:MAG: DUF5721 family protein [Lachnospiraceae bacterium]|nr:DUF5721 family protein [Lachnospiraceae bacterium]